MRFLAESLIHDETSPSYIHEGVGEVEVTWQWEVPAANLHVLASDSPERHFDTAFYDVERAGNRIIRASRKSRDMVFYGRGFDALSCHSTWYTGLRSNFW